MKTRLVRTLRTYNHIHVANAMYMLGYQWHRDRIPTNVVAMLTGLPRCHIERVLLIVEGHQHKDHPRGGSRRFDSWCFGEYPRTCKRISKRFAAQKSKA